MLPKRLWCALFPMLLCTQACNDPEPTIALAAPQSPMDSCTAVDIDLQGLRQSDLLSKVVKVSCMYGVTRHLAIHSCVEKPNIPEYFDDSHKKLQYGIHSSVTAQVLLDAEIFGVRQATHFILASIEQGADTIGEKFCSGMKDSATQFYAVLVKATKDLAASGY
jgi:hypothetical protein